MDRDKIIDTQKNENGRKMVELINDIIKDLEKHRQHRIDKRLTCWYMWQDFIEEKSHVRNLTRSVI